MSQARWWQGLLVRAHVCVMDYQQIDRIHYSRRLTADEKVTAIGEVMFRAAAACPRCAWDSWVAGWREGRLARWMRRGRG